MKFYMYLALVWCGLLTGCGSDNDPEGESEDQTESSWDDIMAVTGLNAFDIGGVPIGTKYTANDHMIAGTFFPNPANSVINFNTAGELSIRNVWIVEGECIKDSTTNIQQLSQNISYTIPEIAEKAVQSRTFSIIAADFQLTLDDLDNGLYKLFIETEDGTLNWQSILIEKSSTQDLDVLFDKYDQICGT